jgi:hypothetical protein
MISPTEIANMAFAPRADALNQTTQFYTQLGAQQQAQRASRELQDAKLTQDFNKDLLDRIAASGTPADEIVINESNDAMNRIAEFNKANPRASRQQKEEYARQVVLPVIAKGQMAKSAFDELKAREALAAKEMPYVDLSQYRKDFAKNFMYDEQGKPRQNFNMAALSDPNLDLANIDVQERYANEAALNPLMQKMYKEGLQPSAQTTQVRDERGNIVDIKYKGIPNIQKLNAGANALEFNTNFVNVGDKVYETFPAEIANPFENDPKFKIAQKRLVKSLKAENKALDEAPESVVNAIATTEVTKRFASGETADITRSYDTQKMINQEKQRAIANARANEQLKLSQRADLRNAQRHEKIMKENPFTPMGDLSLIVSGTLAEKGRPLIENSRKILAKKYGIPTDNEAYNAVLPYLSKETKQEANDLVTKGNIAQAGSLVKMVDLSAANKGQFNDYSKRAAYRLISVTDNNTNKVHLIKLYPPQPEIDASGNPKTDKKTGEVIMRNLPPEYVKDIEGQMLYLQNQMIGTPQKVKEEIVTPYTISPSEEEN